MSGRTAHRVRPAAASRSAAASTESVACCVATQPSSSRIPSANSTRGAKPRSLPRQRDVREAVPDVTGAELVHDLGLQVLLAQAAGQLAGDVEHRGGDAGAEVDGAVVGAAALERRHAAGGDVGDVHEVAALEAVLEHQRRLVVQQPAAEDRGHACVGVGQGLPVAVDVEEAHGHGGQAVGSGRSRGTSPRGRACSRRRSTSAAPACPHRWPGAPAAARSPGRPAPTAARPAARRFAPAATAGRARGSGSGPRRRSTSTRPPAPAPAGRGASRSPPAPRPRRSS